MSPHCSKIAPYSFCNGKGEWCETQQFWFTGFTLLLIWHFWWIFFQTAVLRPEVSHTKLPSGTWIWVSPSWGETLSRQQTGKERAVAPPSCATSILGWTVPFGLGCKPDLTGALQLKVWSWTVGCLSACPTLSFRAAGPSALEDTISAAKYMSPKKFWVGIFGRRLLFSLWAALSDSSTLTQAG